MTIEVTIETPFEVVDGDTRWAGEPLTADAAGALLPLNFLEVTSGRIATDDTLVLSIGAATLTVRPDPNYEAWQVRTHAADGARRRVAIVPNSRRR